MSDSKFHTFHDLLNFHLESDDFSRRRFVERAFDAVNGKAAIAHSCNIVVFQVNHLVCVLYYCTEMEHSFELC